MKFSLLLAVVMAVALLLAAPSVWAQGVSGSASVGGTVTDETGAVIPGASVVLINVERGSEQEVSTNEAGIYVYPDVTPGVYTVRVSVSTPCESRVRASQRGESQFRAGRQLPPAALDSNGAEGGVLAV